MPGLAGLKGWQARVEPRIAGTAVLQSDNVPLGPVLAAFKVVEASYVRARGGAQQQSRYLGTERRDEKRVAGTQRLDAAELIEPGGLEFISTESTSQRKSAPVRPDR